MRGKLPLHLLPPFLLLLAPPAPFLALCVPTVLPLTQRPPCPIPLSPARFSRPPTDRVSHSTWRRRKPSGCGTPALPAVSFRCHNSVLLVRVSLPRTLRGAHARVRTTRAGPMRTCARPRDRPRPTAHRPRQAQPAQALAQHHRAGAPARPLARLARICAEVLGKARLAQRQGADCPYLHPMRPRAWHPTRWTSSRAPRARIAPGLLIGAESRLDARAMHSPHSSRAAGMLTADLQRDDEREQDPGLRRAHGDQLLAHAAHHHAVGRRVPLPRPRRAHRSMPAGCRRWSGLLTLARPLLRQARTASRASSHSTRTRCPAPRTSSSTYTSSEPFAPMRPPPLLLWAGPK